MKVLVTGANGFVGSYLVRELVERGREVIAGVRNPYIGFLEGVEICFIHLSQIDEMKKVLSQKKPDVIFHLAGQSNVPLAWSNPSETLAVNAIGTIELMKAAHEAVPNVRLITVGSSEEYGLSAKSHELLDEVVE